jgi:hypothetical protein
MNHTSFIAHYSHKLHRLHQPAPHKLGAPFTRTPYCIYTQYSGTRPRYLQHTPTAVCLGELVSLPLERALDRLGQDIGEHELRV